MQDDAAAGDAFQRRPPHAVGLIDERTAVRIETAALIEHYDRLLKDLPPKEMGEVRKRQCLAEVDGSFLMESLSRQC